MSTEKQKTLTANQQSSTVKSTTDERRSITRQHPREEEEEGGTGMPDLTAARARGETGQHQEPRWKSGCTASLEMLTLTAAAAAAMRKRP
jgi:hypothetical protein